MKGKVGGRGWWREQKKVTDLESLRSASSMKKVMLPVNLLCFEKQLFGSCAVLRMHRGFSLKLP